MPLEQTQLMADALKAAGKPVELVILDGENHYLTRATTRTRRCSARQPSSQRTCPSGSPEGAAQNGILAVGLSLPSSSPFVGGVAGKASGLSDAGVGDGAVLVAEVGFLPGAGGVEQPAASPGSAPGPRGGRLGALAELLVAEIALGLGEAPTAWPRWRSRPGSGARPCGRRRSGLAAVAAGCRTTGPCRLALGGGRGRRRGRRRDRGPSAHPAAGSAAAGGAAGSARAGPPGCLAAGGVRGAIRIGMIASGGPRSLMDVEHRPLLAPMKIPAARWARTEATMAQLVRRRLAVGIRAVSLASVASTGGARPRRFRGGTGVARAYGGRGPKASAPRACWAGG